MSLLRQVKEVAELLAGNFTNVYTNEPRLFTMPNILLNSVIFALYADFGAGHVENKVNVGFFEMKRCICTLNIIIVTPHLRIFFHYISIDIHFWYKARKITHHPFGYTFLQGHRGVLIDQKNE